MPFPICHLSFIMKESAPIFYQLIAPVHPPDFQGSTVVLFFIHASRREKHPQSSLLVFFKIFHSDSYSKFGSAAPQSQSVSLHCSSVHLHRSHTLVGSSLGQASSFYFVQFQTAKLCFAALMLRVYHRSSPSCITGSASSFSVPFPPPKDHGRDIQAPRYTGPIRFLDWLS